MCAVIFIFIWVWWARSLQCHSRVVNFLGRNPRCPFTFTVEIFRFSPSLTERLTIGEIKDPSGWPTWPETWIFSCLFCENFIFFTDIHAVNDVAQVSCVSSCQAALTLSESSTAGRPLEKKILVQNCHFNAGNMVQNYHFKRKHFGLQSNKLIFLQVVHGSWEPCVLWCMLRKWHHGVLTVISPKQSAVDCPAPRTVFIPFFGITYKNRWQD